MPNGMPDSYLIKQGSTYHYRRRVPADIQPHVGTRWWKRTLRCAQEREAKAKARVLAAKHDQLIRTIREATLPERYRSIVESLDFIRDAKELVPPHQIGKAARFNEARQLDAHATQAAAKLKRAMIAAAEQRLDTLPDSERDAIADLGGVEAFFDQAIVASDDVEIDRIRLTLQQGSGKLSARATDITRANLDAKAAFAARDQQTLVKLGLATHDSSHHEDPANPRLASAMEAWFAERKQGHLAVKRHRVAINRFIEQHGNLAVRDVTKAMVRDYVKRVADLPDHRKLPARQRGGLADPGEHVPRIAAPTVERHLVSIKALLNFCVEQDWVASSVATALKAPRDTPPKAAARRPFTREERNQVLARAILEHGEDGDMPWFVRLAAYTGARAEELAQLAPGNVRKVDGVWAIEVDDLDGRNVKTSGSVKQVPLHPAIRDGFVAWVASGRGSRVFASFHADKEGRFANKVSGDFARLMDRAGLPDPRLTLHSMRHTLKREMSNARLDPDVRRAILGHAGRDAHDGYAGPSLETISDELARMDPLFD